MEANPVPNNSKSIIKYLAIGATGLALTGGAYLLYKKIEKKRQKDRVLRILKMIRKELFPILNHMKNMRETILEPLKGRTFLAVNAIDQIINMGNSEVCSCFITT